VAHTSSAELLVMHGLRVKGMADAAAVAQPFALDRELVDANDHTDWSWDDCVFDELHGLQGRLQPVGEQLAAALARFDGYAERYSAALDRVDRGERAWVAQPKIDSCHTVWMELHEDLLATLGLERGS
jgi:hypothetical protein